MNYSPIIWCIIVQGFSLIKLELVYLTKGKYCVYPRMVYRLAIVMPPPPHFGWPKMNFDRISRLFRSICIFILEVRFAPKTIWFFHDVLSMAMPNMKLIGEFMTQLETPQAFWEFLYKMAARGHFVFPIDAKNHRVLVIRDINGYGEYEFDRCICDKVMACTIIGVRRRRNQKHNITKISGISELLLFFHILVHVFGISEID